MGPPVGAAGGPDGVEGGDGLGVGVGSGSGVGDGSEGVCSGGSSFFPNDRFIILLTKRSCQIIFFIHSFDSSVNIAGDVGILIH